MGEGLMADKARDTAFLLTGDPMTIQEGKRATAQAISDH